MKLSTSPRLRTVTALQTARLLLAILSTNTKTQWSSEIHTVGDLFVAPDELMTSIVIYHVLSRMLILALLQVVRWCVHRHGGVWLLPRTNTIQWVGSIPFKSLSGPVWSSEKFGTPRLTVTAWSLVFGPWVAFPWAEGNWPCKIFAWLWCVAVLNLVSVL